VRSRDTYEQGFADGMKRGGDLSPELERAEQALHDADVAYDLAQAVIKGERKAADAARADGYVEGVLATLPEVDALESLLLDAKTAARYFSHGVGWDEAVPAAHRFLAALAAHEAQKEGA